MKIIADIGFDLLTDAIMLSTKKPVDLSFYRVLGSIVEVIFLLYTFLDAHKEILAMNIPTKVEYISAHLEKWLLRQLPSTICPPGSDEVDMEELKVWLTICCM